MGLPPRRASRLTSVGVALEQAIRWRVLHSMIMPRPLIPALLCLVVLLVGSAAQADTALSTADMDALIAAIPPQALDELHSADFMTVRDLTANLPHGSLTITRGVIASYKGAERHTAGIVIGDIAMVLDRLPEGGYNAFPELGSGETAHTFNLTQSFLYASPVSQAYLKEIGFVAALRKWDALKPAEQRQFLEVLAQAWPESWGGAVGAPRDPVEQEVYGAAWVKEWPETPAGSVTRIDMWVEADGKTTRAVEHDSGKLLAQYPWDGSAPETGEPESGEAGK